MGKYKHFSASTSTLFTIAAFITILAVGGRIIYNINQNEPSSTQLNTIISDKASLENVTVTHWPHHLTIDSLDSLRFNGTDDSIAKINALISDLQSDNHAGLKQAMKTVMALSFLEAPVLGLLLFASMLVAKIMVKNGLALAEPCVGPMINGAAAVINGTINVASSAGRGIGAVVSAIPEHTVSAAQGLRQGFNRFRSGAGMCVFNTVSENPYTENTSGPSSSVEADPSATPPSPPSL